MTQLSRTNRSDKHEPTVGDQLVAIGENCLELRTFPAWDAIMMGWTGCLAFILSVPFINELVVLPVLDTFSNTSSASFYSDLFWSMLFTLLFLGMTLGFSYFHIRHISRYSNIRFNRHTGKIYATVHGQPCEANWNTVSAVVKSRLTGGGGVYTSETTLNIRMREISNRPKYPKLEMRGIIKPTFVDSGFEDGAICLWEFIATYMEDGPVETLILRKPEGYLKTARKISLPPKENVKHYFPWPITTTADDFGWRVIKRILWPAKILVYPVAVGSQFLWHIMYTLFKGQFPPLPKESETGCDKNRLTIEDYSHCGDPEVQYVTYQQALACKQKKI